jgi:hypothetical protein
MTATSSPWAREASPSVTLPPPPAPPQQGPPAPPPGVAPAQRDVRPPRQPRRWPWAVLALVITVVLSAAVASTVTYLATRGDNAPSPARPSAAAPSTPALPQVNPADAAAAKQNLCQTFDVSVRGQEGQGGVRVAGGGINTPLVLRAMNSASTVQNALVPAVPPDVAAAARKYITATLDQTTAAMGNTPTSEVNRLTDVRNDATFALVDACGLPR